MVELKVLSGKKAGTSWVTRHFPVRIGRSSQADLQLEDDGVWEQHMELLVRRGVGFCLKALPNALVAVNATPVSQAEVVLRNGDTIQAGAVRLQFWLARARQTGLAFREWAVWTAVVLISLAQVGLVYYLLTL